jgi:hypothetical protein
VIDESSTLEDVCFEVGSALDRFSIRGVLTGGSAAAVYASAVYTSLDADFVLANSPERKQIEAALAEVGYAPSAAAGTYEHPRSKFTIDFPKGPLAVGGDYVKETAVLERGAMRLRILTPTDCVRDRLAAFYYWNDYTSLNAAVGVARAHVDQIDFALLREWTEREGGPPPLDFGPKFKEFLKRVGLPNDKLPLG